MTVSRLGQRALAWLKQTSTERKATLAFKDTSEHTLHDIGIDRGGIDYAVRHGRISL